MICLEGTGAISHVSVHNKPDIFNEPCVFAAVCVKGQPNVARVIEGPVPGWKLFGQPNTGNGAGGKTYGLPRFAEAEFTARFPFATITLADRKLPLAVEITGWSPFEPGDADNSSLPVAGLEYRFTNTGKTRVDAVFSFNARNFMATGAGQAVRPAPGGFILWGAGSQEKPWEEGAFLAAVTDPSVKVNHAWFRGGWFDPLTMAWKDVQDGACYDRPPISEGDPAPGASLFVPLQLAPGASRTVVLQLAWFSGRSDVRQGKDPQTADANKQGTPAATYQPWYTGAFANIEELAARWRRDYDRLRANAKRFCDCFYDTTLPPEVVEAVAANLTILKSPTVLRQADGRLWGWEGCRDAAGCCPGSCTHVWNYAHALARLFPELERSVREMQDFGPGFVAATGAVNFRGESNDFWAGDSQGGTALKCLREHQMSLDSRFLERNWPKIRKTVEFLMDERGNLYFIEVNARHDINGRSYSAFGGARYDAPLGN